MIPTMVLILKENEKNRSVVKAFGAGIESDFSGMLGGSISDGSANRLH
jgi:hypothetical protein